MQNSICRKFPILFSGKILWHRLKFITMNICHIEDEIARLRKNIWNSKNAYIIWYLKFYILITFHKSSERKNAQYATFCRDLFEKSKKRKYLNTILSCNTLQLKNILYTLYKGCIIYIFKKFLLITKLKF